MKMVKGFTLIEMMIVIAIIGIMAVVAIPKMEELITKYKAQKEGQAKSMKKF